MALQFLSPFLPLQRSHHYIHPSQWPIIFPFGDFLQLLQLGLVLVPCANMQRPALLQLRYTPSMCACLLLTLVPLPLFVLCVPPSRRQPSMAASRLHLQSLDGLPACTLRDWMISSTSRTRVPESALLSVHAAPVLPVER